MKIESYIDNGSHIETVLWAVKINDPDYMEEILYKCKGYVNKEQLLAKGREFCEKNGYNRMRISVFDLNEKPDFKKTINL